MKVNLIMKLNHFEVCEVEKEANQTVRARFLPTSGFLSFIVTMLENKKRSHALRGVQCASLAECTYFPMVGLCFTACL